MTLGAEVRRLRVAGGLTQRELAEPAYTRAFVAAIESGARTPSDEALAHIAARLGVEPEDLRHARPPGAAETLRARLGEARRRMSHGEFRAAADEFGAVRAEAAAYQLPEIVGWAGYHLGEVSLHQGEVAAAAEAFEAVAGSVPSGAAKLDAAVTARLGYCWFALGDTQRALVLLEGKLRTLRSEPDQHADAQARVASMLMYTYNELDWSERARRLERETLPLLSLVDDSEWIAQFLSTAAQLRREESELEDLDRMLSEAVRRYRDLDLKREIGVCHWARGYVLRRAARLPEAAAEFRAARAILATVGAVQDLAGATLELAEALRRQGILDEAAALAAEAAHTSTQTGHTEGMAEAARLLGLIAAQRGDPPAAERLLASAADRYEAAGLMTELLTTCGLLGDLLLAQGRRAEATAVLRRGLRGAERLR